MKSESIGSFGLASQSQRLQAFLNEEEASQKEKELYKVDTSSLKSSSKIEEKTSSLKSDSSSSQLEESSDIKIKSILNPTSQEYSAKSALEKAIQTEKNFPKKSFIAEPVLLEFGFLNREDTSVPLVRFSLT